MTDIKKNLEDVALYALLRDDRLKWPQIRDLLERAGSADAALKEHLAAYLIDEEYIAALAESRQTIAAFTASGIHTDTYLSDTYPVQMLTVYDFPPVVYWRGYQDEADARSVAIVGTRTPSEGATKFVIEFAGLLGRQGIPVVSGLARGTDTAAMRASLDVGNRTVGVIGTGLNRQYPKENAGLQEAIANGHLLLSQFHPDASASPKTFPMRNVVMSAYSSMTVIAEAGEKSGTRVQAQAAVKHGRPLIISRAVFQQTWGKDLVDRGLDVTVVSNAHEALAAVHEVHERQSRQGIIWAPGTLLVK
ncbi:DNA-processing protein DprA [Cryobacterium frigoriphilum]|uniref:DNA-processing protein DprA n=1 Tax=Cryobacterium frigoriphilum TaxID=1259150 RepID=A0A4R8ZTY4_9MICO|nr:DNA-processing protein DprA [Cryobacterium frigoriphilum]TFD45381.1 DNA-processing protein DprA [Cryobacterium frigoriphilum]